MDKLSLKMDWDSRLFSRKNEGKAKRFTDQRSTCLLTTKDGYEATVFENNSKSLIFQHCERSELRLFSCLFTFDLRMSAVCLHLYFLVKIQMRLFLLMFNPLCEKYMHAIWRFIFYPFIQLYFQDWILTKKEGENKGSNSKIEKLL